MNIIKNRENYIILLFTFLAFCAVPIDYFFSNIYQIIYAKIVVKFAAIFIIIWLSKRYKMIPKIGNKSVLNARLFLPFFILPFSNFLVSLVLKINPTAPYFDIDYLLLNILLCLFTAFLEEYLFRFIFLSRFLSSYSPLKAILFSSLLFGCCHLIGISSISSIPFILMQSIYSFFIGILYGFIYVKRKSLFLPILLHFLFNAINDAVFSYFYIIDFSFKFYLFNFLFGAIIFIYVCFLYLKFKIE